LLPKSIHAFKYESLEFEKAKDQDKLASQKANDFVDQMHTKSMQANSRGQRLAQLRSSSSKNIKPELTDLEPLDPNKWCQ